VLSFKNEISAKKYRTLEPTFLFSKRQRLSKPVIELVMQNKFQLEEKQEGYDLNEIMMEVESMRRDHLKRYLKGLWLFVDVKGWQKWLGAAVMGFAFALGLGNDFSLLQIQGLVIGFPLILTYTMTVNDCFDIEIDKVKQEVMGKELIISNIISRRTALTLTLLSVIIGLVSAWITSLSFFIITSAFVLVSTVYSVPPFRFKMKYPISTLTQFAGIFLPFVAGVASVSVVTIQAFVISSVFAVLAIIHRFDHEIYTFEADLLTGKHTVAVTKGIETAKTLRRLCAFVGIAEFAVFFIVGWVDSVFLFLFILYLIIYYYILRSLFDRVRSMIITVPTIIASSYILLFVVLLLYGEMHL
jgi:4-hydroxybenzoate polyprenyltransferase